MILAFDTATDWLTVAIGTADRVAAEFNGPAPRAHLTRLLPTVKQLLDDSGVTLDRVTHVAVGIGPGSFTGVRIAVATAQGLAHALNRPLIGVSTLDAIAAGLASGAGREIFPVLDAKRREVYTAGYDHNGARLTDYLVLYPQDLARLLVRRNKPVLLAGDGLTAYGDELTDQAGGLVASAGANFWQPSAHVLIRLAMEKIKSGDLRPYFSVLPIYIRLSDAEEALKREKSS